MKGVSEMATLGEILYLLGAGILGGVAIAYLLDRLGVINIGYSLKASAIVSINAILGALCIIVGLYLSKPEYFERWATFFSSVR